MARPTCSLCGSAACLVQSPEHCRHTMRRRPEITVQDGGPTVTAAPAPSELLGEATPATAPARPGRGKANR